MAHILVVDDYEAILVMLQLSLGVAGHRVTTAATGVLALTLAKSVRPDLVLLDIDMPEMDGLTVCAALKRDPDLAATPVVLMTGRPSAKIEEAARRAGARALVNKPFDRDDLLEKIARLVRASPPSAEGK